MTALQTALAVERYRVTAGKPPAALAELRPNYLASIPKDPFDEQPIRYKTLERGYVVWSIGADGVDDDGAERADRSATNKYDAGIMIER
jgi:hypothetical protein